MVDIDLSGVKKKRPKISVSLSLDKENIEFLKEDMEKVGEGITLSGVFDFWLSTFVKSIKKQREQEEIKGEGEKGGKDES